MDFLEREIIDKVMEKMAEENKDKKEKSKKEGEGDDDSSDCLDDLEHIRLRNQLLDE